MKQHIDEPINELFGFGKKKRLQCIIVVADDVPNMSDYSLTQISNNVADALKTDNRVQDLEAFYRDADSLPVAKEVYAGRARAVFMYTCANYTDYDAVEARVRTWAVDGFVWSSKVDYYKKLRNILHFDIVLPDTRKKESFTQGVSLMKDNIWEALDELYEDMPQPVDYSGMPEAQLIKTAYDLGKQSSELVDKIRYHQAAQGPSYWAQRGALQKAQQDFDAMSEQYDAVEAQLVKRGLDIWSTVNGRQISIVVIGVDAHDAIKLSPDLTIYKYCVDQSGKLVNLLNRPAYYLPPTIDNLCMPYLIASTEAAHPGASCKLVPSQVIRDGCIAYEQKTKSFAIYTMADTLSQEVAALLPAGYTGVVYLGTGANTLSSEPEFRRDDHVQFGLFKRNATLEGQVDRRPIRKFTEFAYLANNAVAPKASATFNIDAKTVYNAAQAAQTRQHAQWQAEYDQQRRQARNAKARERRAAMKAKANAASTTDDIVQ